MYHRLSPKRWLGGLVVTLLCLPAAPVAASPSPSGSADVTLRGAGGGYRFNWTEKCFMKKINRRRTNHGKKALGWDLQLGYVARKHARAMASSRSIWHDSALGDRVTRWKRLGQNVGSGKSCKRLFKAFWHSSTHRDNMLGSWRFMGVGVKKSGGAVYVHQVFESRRNPGNVYHKP